MIAGLTGSIGTGKSTVAAMFAGLGAEIIDFDVLAHEVIQPGRPAWQETVAVFGNRLLRPDGTIDRARLGDIVFRDPALLAELNRIVHPAVFAADAERTAAILAERPRAVIIKDIPLLTAEVARRMVEKVVVVYASPAVQMKRLLGRGLAEEDAKRRIAAQTPVEEKLKFADYVIDNDGRRERTREQVERVYKELALLA
jgi:dephospho-CoA kinase